VDELPLLQLFTQLREVGVPLGVKDYQSALQALQAGYGLTNRAALARLCRTLWIRSAEEERLFDYHFEQIIGSPTECEIQNGENSTKPGRTVMQLVTSRTAIYVTLFSVVLLSFGVVGWWKSSQNQTPPIPPPTPTQTPTGTGISTLLTNNWLIWGALLTLTLVTSYIGFSRFLLSRRHKTPSAQSLSSPTPAELTSELLRETKDEVQVAQTMWQLTGKEKQELPDHFLLSANYLPVTQRQMKQSWRYLRRMISEQQLIILDAVEFY